MKKISTFLSDIWNDESGQGTAEYVLLLVIVVGLVMAFKAQIVSAVSAKLGDLSSSISGINSN